MRRAPRECGAGCGATLRRGHARTAYVLTCDGALHRTLVCPLCARRGVLTIAHLDEPLRQRPPLRVKPRKVSPWFAAAREDPDGTPALPSVGTMSREQLEAEAAPLLGDGADLEQHMERQRRRAEVRGLSRSALEVCVAVLRAQSASSSGTVPASSVYEDREP